ncbi:MAG TPA: OmpA family protein [Gemmatimonadaceae bacterium]|nr:OmpA family protein [Gemmatimonadaceae bacterium]
MRVPRIVLPLTMAAALLAAAAPADAQGFGSRLKKRAEEAAKRTIENRVDEKSTEATDAALDKTENTVKCAASDKACIDKAKKEGKKVVSDDGAEGGAGEAASAAAPEKVGEGAFVNFDFVPGDRVIFYEDFTKDNIGDFPRRLEFQNGNLEVAEWKGAKYLRASEWSTIFIPLPEVLPERFTMEFEFSTGYKATGGADLEVWFQEAGKDWYDHSKYGVINFGYGRTQLAAGKVRAEGKYPKEIDGQFIKARIMADGNYVKVYVDGQRVANVPNAQLGRSNKIRMVIPARSDAMLVGNIRVAAGGKKLYDAIAEKGRVATQGIFFDTGSDHIRPESAPTLKEIAAMMKEHADLRLTIEGHTDNVGGAAANQTLSEKRAAAVKARLVSEYGIEEGRLAAKGLGAAKPAASNDTAEGRQQNRRVELVKM